MSVPRAALLLSAAYFIAAELGLALTFGPKPVSVLWLPNAILLGGLVLTSPRSWWLLLLAVLPAHLGAQLWSGVPLAMVLGWFVSNSAEALIGAGLLRLLVEPPIRLDRTRSAVVFILTAGFLAPFLSSFLDAALVTWNGWGESPYWSVWKTRILSNSLAALITVPAILAWAGGDYRLREVSPRRRVEAVLLLTGLVGATLVAFGLPGTRPPRAFGLLYAPLPFILWAALRFGCRGASPSLLVLVLLCIWSAVHGRGPFVSDSPAEAALAMQLLFIGTAGTLVLLVAAVEERRSALDVVRLRSEQLQLALDAGHMGVWEYRIHSGALELSATSKGLLGFDLQEPVDSIGRLLDNVHPGDRLALSKATARSAVGGELLDVEFQVGTAADDVRWVRQRGKALLDQRGLPTRLVGLYVDVTQHKQEEAFASRQRPIVDLIATGTPLGTVLDRLVDLVESESPEVSCSILLLEPDGQHLRHGASGSLPREYVSAIDGGKIGPRAGSCGTAAHRRAPVIVEDIARDPLWEDYRELALRFNLRACWSTPIVSEQDRVLGTFAVYAPEPRGPRPMELRLVEAATHFAAIALERHRAELEAHEQQRTIAHLGRVVMLGELSGALAHELRQPLGVILGAAQWGLRLLRTSNPDPSEMADILEEIVAADQRAGEVIRRQTAMLRKESVGPVALDLNELVTSALELARADLAPRGVRVDARLAPDLPEALCDRVGLQQVLLNLVSNACDAMSTKSAADRGLRVETGYSPAEGQVELSISDRGTGIPADMLHRIFEPFFTLKANGLGIGLAICRSIVQAHGGQLRAENNPDGGATFRISLPRAEAQGLRPIDAEPSVDAQAGIFT